MLPGLPYPRPLLPVLGLQAGRTTGVPSCPCWLLPLPPEP